MSEHRIENLTISNEVSGGIRVNPPPYDLPFCGACNNHHAKDGVCVAGLEDAVVVAAIRFRQAEKAAWVESEVGTKESAAQAKAERPRAYIAFVEAVDALLRSKSREESK